MTGPIDRRTFLFGLVGVTVLGLPQKARSAIGLFDPFSFGFVSDVNLCIGVPDTYIVTQESQLFLQDVVKQLNTEKLDFVIFGGDQIYNMGRDQSNWQLFLDVVQTLEHPWSFVLGGHDIEDKVPVDKMKTFGPDWRRQGVDTEHPYWSMSPISGVHIIGLDTSRPHCPSGYVSKKQLDWLKDDLEENIRRFTIVFSHHPLLPPPPYDSGPPWDDYILPEGPSVREILGSSKYVRLAVSGHAYTSRAQEEGRIWYVSNPGLCIYPCAYRIFRVTAEAITVETYQVSYGALIKRAREFMISSSLAYKYNRKDPGSFLKVLEGRKMDQNVSLPLLEGKEAQAMPSQQKKKEKLLKKKRKEEAKARKRAEKEGKKKKKSREKKGGRKDKDAGRQPSKPAETAPVSQGEPGQLPASGDSK